MTWHDLAKPSLYKRLSLISFQILTSTTVLLLVKTLYCFQRLTPNPYKHIASHGALLYNLSYAFSRSISQSRSIKSQSSPLDKNIFHICHTTKSWSTHPLPFLKSHSSSPKTASVLFLIFHIALALTVFPLRSIDLRLKLCVIPFTLWQPLQMTLISATLSWR